jgi:hypothetical protein
MNVTLSQPWTPDSGVLEFACLLRLRNLKAHFRLWWGPLRHLVASRLQSRNLSFIFLLGIQLGIHSLDLTWRDSLWLQVLRRFFCSKGFSLGSMHIVPPVVTFALKQVIEEGMTRVTCDTRTFRIWVSVSGTCPRNHRAVCHRARGPRFPRL